MSQRFRPRNVADSVTSKDSSSQLKIKKMRTSYVPPAKPINPEKQMFYQQMCQSLIKTMTNIPKMKKKANFSSTFKKIPTVPSKTSAI